MVLRIPADGRVAGGDSMTAPRTMPHQSPSQDPQVGSNSSDAVQQLMQQHGGMLFGLGRRFCGNEDEAADLVQETMLEAFKSWPTFRGEAKATTWLYRIAARTCQRMHRKKGPNAAELPSDDVLLDQCGFAWMGSIAADTPLDDAIQSEARERLEAAIIDLPIEYRMPLVLKEIVGFTSPEIADITGLNDTTIRVRVHRARLALRKAIEKGLPYSATPEDYESQVCQDLLEAKQEAMDRGAEFEVPRGVLTDRCRAVFDSLDLTQNLCHTTEHTRLPDDIAARINHAIAQSN